MNQDEIDQHRGMHAGGMLFLLLLAVLFAPYIARWLGLW